MDALVVDAVVAVHNDRRPVERPVASLLLNSVPLRVTVVAHNVDADAIRGRLGPLADDGRVRILPLQDGVHSPANAFDHGLDAATAEYVSIVGSDDSLEPGALDAWVALAARTSADMIIAPIVRDSGHGVPTPRIRRSRAGRILHADRDRLFERAAPLGLQRRTVVPDLRFTRGLPRGEDQAYGLTLWTSARVVFAPDVPAYREHGDQRDRVTHEFGPLSEDFAFLTEYRELVVAFPAALRRATVAKMIRVHLVPAVRVRADRSSLTAKDMSTARDVLADLEALAPGVRGLLPSAVRSDVAAIAEGSLAGAVSAAQKRSGIVHDLIPLDPRFLVHRHGPARTMLAGRWVARSVTRHHAARRSTGLVDTGPPTVILSPHVVGDAVILRDEVGGMLIGWAGRGSDVVDATVPLPPRWAMVLNRTLGRSFPGRIMLRLIGADSATWFARGIRRSPAVRDVIEHAHLVVAAEEDATFAAWRAARASRRTRAVYGIAAARTALADGAEATG